MSRLIRFANMGVALAQPPPPPPDIVVPNCVGQAVLAALAQLEAVGLRGQTFAADLNDGLPRLDWHVRSHTPTAGSTLPQGRVVQLYAQPAGATQPMGVKTVRVFNQYQQRRALQVWNRDITAGTWTDEGTASFGAGPVTVDLVDGHVHALFYADYALNSCQPQPTYPPDVCVYRGPDGPVLGDDDGPTVDVVVS